ncbi:MAG TPA: sigma-70 family RNA polymerase sigma factor [Burkholderiaceae bacterium]|nr:sigma-70 family RNA polymerase sigma factor [Burkholderiaceae bacterium]
MQSSFDRAAELMQPLPEGEVTGLLRRWSAGESAAMDALFPLVYEELRRMAVRHMRGEWSQRTLSPTGLVHEAYLRLSSSGERPGLDSRGRFFAWASTLMRHILVDHARARHAEKRGSGVQAQSLEHLQEQAHAAEVFGASDTDADTAADVLALDQALNRLDQVDPTARQIVECRFFGGLSVEETGEALSLPESSIKRDWIIARAWLLREMHSIRQAHSLWADAVMQSR